MTPSPQRSRSLWKPALALLLLLPLALAAAVLLNFWTIPHADTAQQHFDAIIVLGTPANPDGSPAPEQRERVLEGVRQYQAGIAPVLIMSGGAAHNRFVEAHVMAELALSRGVPSTALVEETRAGNTIQNIFYSDLLMQQHGWKSAEIVSSPSHLPRAALILEHYRFPWRTDAAHWPPAYERSHIAGIYTAEALYCLRLRLFGFKPSPFLPTGRRS